VLGHTRFDDNRGLKPRKDDWERLCRFERMAGELGFEPDIIKTAGKDAKALIHQASVWVQALGAPLGAASGRGDYRYLIQPRGSGTTWYAVAEVPRTLRAVLGKKRLTRSFKTEDVRLARVARWRAIDEMKSEIADAGGGPTLGDQQKVFVEALAYREELAKVSAERLFCPDHLARQTDRVHAE
jgi:hypothetical protein